MTDLFDAGAMYDDDYLYFFAASPGAGTVEANVPAGTDEAVADRVWSLLDLQPGMRVLDLCCGHGDLANALAARGCVVTGLDSSEVFLRRARADAAAGGVEVEYVAGDMRALPWTAEFDRVVNWSTAFGYFDDDVNRAVLGEIARTLRPGGRVAMDLDNLIRFLADFVPSRVTAVKDNGDLLVDRYHLDALTGRFEATRTVVRDGRARTLTFVKRLFAFPELRDWLYAAGFTEVTAYGEDNTPLRGDHTRMIAVAQLP
jgi:SAM-dependent methyltransferase